MRTAADSRFANHVDVGEQGIALLMKTLIRILPALPTRTTAGIDRRIELLRGTTVMEPPVPAGWSRRRLCGDNRRRDRHGHWLFQCLVDRCIDRGCSGRRRRNLGALIRLVNRDARRIITSITARIVTRVRVSGISRGLAAVRYAFSSGTQPG